MVQDLARRLGLEVKPATLFVDFILKLSRLVKDKEAELAEINPLAILSDGSCMALDSKVIIDDNSIFRHPETEKISASI